MTYGKAKDDLYILRLERGEEILTTLTAFCHQHSINNAAITGIGSASNPTLAHYTTDTKAYSEKKLEGIYEVTGMHGTIALVENAPTPHIHITLGDKEMNAFAGHLIKAEVSATLEVLVTIFPTTYTKSKNEEIGLNLYDLPEKIS